MDDLEQKGYLEKYWQGEFGKWFGKDYGKISDRFLFDYQNEDVKAVGTKDSKFGMNTLSDQMRLYEIFQITNAVKQGKLCAIWELDFNQLKKVNEDVDRAAGDEYLRWYMAKITNRLTENNLSGFLTRGGQGADELRLVLVDIQEEELAKLKELGSKINEEYQEIEMKKPGSSKGVLIRAAMAGAVVATNEPRFAQLIQSDQPELTPMYFDLYNGMVQAAEEEAGSIKNMQELKSLPDGIMDAKTGLKKFKNLIVERLGKGRVGKTALRRVLSSVALKAVEKVPDDWDKVEERFSQVYGEPHTRETAPLSKVKSEAFANTDIDDYLRQQLGEGYDQTPEVYRPSEDFLKIYKTKADERSGLAVYSNELRAGLAVKLAESVGKGERVVIIGADADQLKQANYYDRIFGDKYIAWEMATITKTFHKLGIEPTKFNFFRKEQAGDELGLMVTGVNEAELADINRAMSEIQASGKTMILPDGTKFEFAISIAMTATDEPRMVEATRATREGRNLLPQGRAYGLLNEMMARVDAKTGQQKIVKEIQGLAAKDFSQVKTLPDLIDLLVDRYGQQRIGTGALNTLCMLVAVAAAKQEVLEEEDPDEAIWIRQVAQKFSALYT